MRAGRANWSLPCPQRSAHALADSATTSERSTSSPLAATVNAVAQHLAANTRPGDDPERQLEKDYAADGEEPPALYRGYAYRPYYRYSAYRRLPRTYFCVTD